MDIIKEPPDDRTIYWFWEEVGNVGKSAFCKYLHVHHEATTSSGKSKDMFHGITKYDENMGYPPEIILIDVPRSNLEFVNYTAIEAIKNGYFFSGKYESAEFCMNPPHIFIFANVKPKMHCMSLDRWHIEEIKKD